MRMNTMLFAAVFVSVLAMGMPTKVTAEALPEPEPPPMFIECICFDPLDRLSRQGARNTCDDKFALSYKAGALHPSNPQQEGYSCAGVKCPEGETAWACLGVGGQL